MHAFARLVSRTLCGLRRARCASSLAALSVSLTLAVSAAQAATITVNNSADPVSGTASNCDPGNANTCTLRYAIARAVGGDTIVFNLVAPNTTIVLSSELLFSYAANTNPITVDGGGTITLDGNEITRVINAAANTSTLLRGLVLTQGRASDGAGILNVGTISLEKSTVSYNMANFLGGGILNFGTLNLTESTISHNEATNGGGIYSSYSLIVTRSLISDNLATADGGGIHNTGDTPTVTQSTLLRNVAERNGGGIYNFFGRPAVTRSALSGNDANEKGGAIYNFGGTLTVAQNTFSNNFARLGAGLYGTSSLIDVRYSSFVGNRASEEGGAVILADLGSASATRSLFMGNSVAGIGIGGAIAKRAGTFNADHNLYWLNPDLSGMQGSNCNNCDSDTNSIVANPLLGPLQNNGGFTDTYLPPAGSAAIDAVPCDPLETIDQRGLTRPQGAQCDVGSVEVQQCSLNLIGDASVRGTADATLALRLMLGIAGPAAVNGVDPSSTWTHVEPRWSACQPSPSTFGCTFDLDGNGTVDPAVDGVLLLRIAMGFKDTAALHGITIPNGAPRGDWGSISGYLQNTCRMLLP